jgi:seryl-tRNA synthetase
MKIEQVVISRADIEESDKLQKEMVSITKEIHEDLGLPYRVMRICVGGLGAGKYKQFDYEAWLPGMNRWAETGSASNFLDWQARRLNVRYADKEGERKFAYLLNNTALPTPRPLIAIMENYQTEKGTVKIPKVLRKYMLGVKEIKPKR